MATLQDLEDWLIKITEHTRMTREALENRSGAGPAAGPAQAKQQELVFEKFGKRIERALGNAVGSRLAQAQALATRGFGGTVEGARYDFAMEQLSRQFAAVMKPMLDGMTYAAVQIERRMRAMGGSEQNRLMGAIVGGGLGLRYGGVPGALLGAIGGAGVMGATGSDTGTVLGAVAGGVTGFRTGGVYGAVAGVAGGAYLGSGGLSKYDEARAAGFNKFSSALISAGGTHGGLVTRALTPDPSERALAALGRSPGTADGRRDVTPFQAQMLEAGGTAGQIQEAIIRATAGADFEENSPFKPLVDAILNKLDLLIGRLDPDYRPPPASATAARG